MTTTQTAKLDLEAHGDPRRWAALTVALLAVFMDLVDITVVVIATPEIMRDLGTGYSSVQWVMAAYSLALGLLLITGGRLGDIFGRKRMFLIGVATFTAASIASGLAPSVGVLVAARVVQGAAAAMMVPQVLAMIQVGFPHHERPKAFGLYGAINGLAAAAAPIVGGLLVGYDVLGLGWRSVFWLNVPIGALALIGGSALMRETRADHRPRLDVPGVVLVTVALLLLLYPLIQGPDVEWPAWTWSMMAASLIAFAAFARTQVRRERLGFPLVPLSLFRRRSFTTGIIASFVMFSAVAAFFLVLTITLQTGHGFSALKVGLIFMAWPVGLAATSGLAVRLVRTVGRRLVSVGALLLTAAMGGLILTIGLAGADLGAWHLVPPLLVGGFGFGLIAPVLVDIVLSAVPARDAGAASGVTNTAIQVSSAAGIATVGALYSSFAARGFDVAAERSLWYAVGAFGLGLVLSFGLPRAAREQ